MVDRWVPLQIQEKIVSEANSLRFLLKPEWDKSHEGSGACGVCPPKNSPLAAKEDLAMPVFLVVKTS